VRALAVVWSAELLPHRRRPHGRRLLAQILLRLSHDGTRRCSGPPYWPWGGHRSTVFERLRDLLQNGAVMAGGRPAPGRCRCTGRTTEPGGKSPVKEVIPLLQKALDDPALEVVRRGGRGAGVLGAPGGRHRC